MKTAAISHVGKVRSINEDTICVRTDQKPYYMMVADGMGGHAAGEVASKITCESVCRYFEEHHMQRITKSVVLKAIEYANANLQKEMQQNEALQGMGTTLTFAGFDGKAIVVAQVGDSRAYYYNGNTIEKITDDHTYVQYLIDSGVIKGHAAADYPFKNIITRAIGMKNLKVDFFHLEWKQGDMLLLCSDGLTNYTDEEILRNVLSSGITLQEKADKLVDIALNGGGKDNISVILAQHADEGEARI